MELSPEEKHQVFTALFEKANRLRNRDYGFGNPENIKYANRLVDLAARINLGKDKLTGGDIIEILNQSADAIRAYYRLSFCRRYPEETCFIEHGIEESLINLLRVIEHLKNQTTPEQD